MGIIFRAVEVYVDTVMNDACHYVTVQTKSNLTILVISRRNPTTFDVFTSGIGEWKTVLSMIL